jgi:hypothetical protein
MSHRTLGLSGLTYLSARVHSEGLAKVSAEPSDRRQGPTSCPETSRRIVPGSKKVDNLLRLFLI